MSVRAGKTKPKDNPPVYPKPNYIHEFCMSRERESDDVVDGVGFGCSAAVEDASLRRLRRRIASSLTAKERFCNVDGVPHPHFTLALLKKSPSSKRLRCESWVYMATTTLRCAAASSARALQPDAGYGGVGARPSAKVVQMCGSLSGTTLHTRSLRGARRAASSSLLRASVAEAASAEVELSVEQAELLERRRAIMQADEQSSGFVVTEVETTGDQDWHSAKVVAVRDVAAGVRCVTLDTEVSREFVSLTNAYTKPGDVAQLRLNSKELTAVPSSPPFSMKINVPVLYKLRGDIPAGTMKLPQYSLSAKAPVELHVEEATNPELYAVTEGQELEVGPYVQSSGLDLRPILTLARFPTVVFFARGRGMAVARAVVEAIDGDNGSMNLSFRDEVRLFCSAPKPSELAYQDKYEDWESKNVKVRVTVDDAAGEEWQGNVGSLTALWDEDDLEYDPHTTGAIVCVEKETRHELMELLEEAGIPKEQIVAWEY